MMIMRMIGTADNDSDNFCGVLISPVKITFRNYVTRISIIFTSRRCFDRSENQMWTRT